MANEFTYRADHIGPLITPAGLLDARKRFAAKEIGADQLREVEETAIKAAIVLQRRAGMSVMSDGGFHRADRSAIKLDGDSLAKIEGAPLRSLTQRNIKVTVPAARPAAGEALDSALARADLVKEEIEALIAAGVDYIQLDAPGYATLFAGGNGATPSHTLDELLQLDARALSGIDRSGNACIAVHFVGSGNAFAKPGANAEGTVERMLQTLPADRFILPMEGATENFEVLRRVPKGRRVVLGLVSAAKPALEDVDDLMARIERAAKAYDGDYLALSPASGFGENSALSEADQQRKLDLVADVATRWWGFAM
jgi:5-methyltetrahydropteroyltriglutamate--homocysteine methyltransferase